MNGFSPAFRAISSALGMVAPVTSRWNSGGLARSTLWVMPRSPRRGPPFLSGLWDAPHEDDSTSMALASLTSCGTPGTTSTTRKYTTAPSAGATTPKDANADTTAPDMSSLNRRNASPLLESGTGGSGGPRPPYAAVLPVATPGRMRRATLLGGRGRGPQPIAEPSDSARAAYAEVPYPGLAFPQSHPDRLATNALLMGMKPAAPEDCRVLELGCGDGGNLIPMAAALEGSEFVGLDLEPSAIARATERAAALGARNATFVAEDLATLDPEQLGRFDYVVAHGVYSWVPRTVADRLLAVCRAVL